MNATISSKELERAPHQATRAVVEAMGDDAPRVLYKTYDELNARFFGGALGAPLLFITQVGSPRALGDYCGRDVHGLRSRIRLAPKSVQAGELFAADVLLHEMVHAYTTEVIGDPEHGYRGHGPTFARKCNEIGQVLGLPTVGVKGRGGLPDCTRWPINVRPEGYYGDAVPTGTKRAKKEQAPKPRDTRASTSSAEEHLWELVVMGVGLVSTITPSEREALGLQVWFAEASAVLGIAA